MEEQVADPFMESVYKRLKAKERAIRKRFDEGIKIRVVLPNHRRSKTSKYYRKEV